MALARLVSEGWSGPGLWVSGALVVAAVGVSPYLGSFGPVTVTVVPFALLIAAAAAADVGGTPSWLVKLGEWSFAFYLLHHIVIRTVDEAHLPILVAVPVMLGLSILGAWMMHRIVERPMVRRLSTVKAT